jgi:hypothetical protein
MAAATPTLTARQLCSLALKDCGAFGVGQTPTQDDINNALIRLNFMIGEWRRKRWLIYHLVDLSVVSTGAQSYTVGPGGDIPVATRPDKLKAAYFRQLIQSQPNQVDFPLDLITSYEDYSRIVIKQLQSFPQFIFYDSGWPLGKLYPWPIPQSAIYEIHIIVEDVLQNFPTLATAVALPDEYYALIFYNLIERLCAAYRIPVPPSVASLAKDARNTVRKANVNIARLQTPADLIRPGIYNPYSDQIR